MVYKIHFLDEEMHDKTGKEMALCRYITYPDVTVNPREVTCVPCIRKLKRVGLR